ncbi:nuclear transport factor 2 family protein [Streptomyces longhuiensis]|uniref:nuclear transport factor 2 family protein n=1 Tax=Streptomyces longhuiensis TaxID=2880933 RepID=UPI001D0B6E37|nr:nuclear transport factor 2 family protein [Streptomyces longhuiensis]UDM02517.1 nuclear transport factor 2 family protein [Streptomyces longhuiensis]
MPHRSSSAPARISAELHVEVQAFYAFQLPLLEDRKLEEFVLTFTEDGSYAQVKDGWELAGRENLLAAMSQAIPYYGNKIFRHWFDKFVIEQVAEDEISVVFRSLVSVTDESGAVVLEPSSTVEDVLVRRDGRLFTRSRVVRRDVAAPDGAPTDAD